MSDNARKLKNMGYRLVSRKYRIASRVDREDWQEFCKESRFPVDADWYRRCVSKDTITISSCSVKELPNSTHDTIGYIEND